ncbi:probable phytol kinase, chloroplastic isoform X1 [Panicum virgatum]|uniref:probable phytol kinase, chloroplastic isoform X1 n=1 Tax=Panicum virgatum TaxID=38727 RepID=UPI0019D62F10|nr:probable phytol kinase, chloroplastic isoform X1 [Panicum virgatum]
MAAAAWPGAGAASASSPNSLLLSRSRPHGPSPASYMPRRLILGVGTSAVAALAATAPPAVLQDGAATLFVTAGAYALVRTFDVLTERRLVEKAEFEQENCARAIRRSVHGILATLQTCYACSNSTEARYFAAVAPFLNSLRLLIYGLRLYTDEVLVKSVAREGKPEELLRGPLYYVLVLLFSVLVFWRESPIGIVSLSMMSGGDGFADIVGRRYGSVKLPFNQKKSWIGSISMFISGFLLSAIMLFYFSSLGYVHVSWEEAFGKLALVALAATVVECIPATDVVDDNISVPLASMFVALLLFGSNTQ